MKRESAKFSLTMMARQRRRRWLRMKPLSRIKLKLS
jgi:hypothetical protein